MSDNVPSKFSTRRLEQCRTTTLTKRMCRRKARQTKKSRDWERYLSLIRATQKTCREAYNNYLIKTLTSAPNGNKRLGALIKSKQHDYLGVAPLKEGNIIYCDPIQKANILNRQFISVFTDDTKTSLQDLGPSQYPSMENIAVSCEGVVKLLKNLKPHKAAGPGDVPLILLKEAADEIAPAITLLFQAYNNYLIKTLTSAPNGNKRLGALIKSKQHDYLGVAPLKEGNIIYCDPIQKANILNRQFISVFTDDTKTSLQDLGPSQYPSMET